MDNIKIYKGIDLLDKILEFVAMTPNQNQWNYGAQNDDKSRLIRLKQIHSLLKAFSFIEKATLFQKISNFLNGDFSKELNSVLKGDFIEKRTIEEYEEATKFAQTYLQNKNYKYDRPIRLMELQFIYPKMVDFKIKLRELLEFNSDWLEASSAFTIFHIRLTNEISSKLDNNFDELDQILELLINPKKLQFTEQELIDKYNFPKEDLHDIDMNNW